MAGQQYRSGDVTINKLLMSKNDGSAVYGILAQTETISITEDLFRPCIIADIHIIDGINLLKTFPIVGNEYIDISFTTPTEPEPYSCRLCIYAVTDLKIDTENQMQRYTLKCCSQEFIYNVGTTVEKGYKTTIDQMILDILQEKLHISSTGYLGGQKGVSIASTQGVQNIVMPRINPFAAIEMLRCRAASSSRLSSSFVFFENKRGFNFLTIEDLFQRGVSNNPKKYYKFTALQSQFESEFAHWHIEDYVVDQQFNIIDAVKSGAYQGHLDNFDWNTKQVLPSQYTTQQFSGFSSLDGSNNVRSVPASNIPLYGTDAGQRRFMISDSTKPATFIDHFLPNKFGFLAPNVTSLYDIYIQGDTTVACGDVININLLKVDKLTDPPPTTPDPLTNGNYLVLRMKHNILVSFNGIKYTAIPSLIKGTYK